MRIKDSWRICKDHLAKSTQDDEHPEFVVSRIYNVVFVVLLCSSAFMTATVLPNNLGHGGHGGCDAWPVWVRGGEAGLETGGDRRPDIPGTRRGEWEMRDERSAKSLTTKHHFTFGSSPDGAKKLREIARIGIHCCLLSVLGTVGIVH